MHPFCVLFNCWCQFYISTGGFDIFEFGGQLKYTGKFSWLQQQQKSTVQKVKNCITEDVDKIKISVSIYGKRSHYPSNEQMKMTGN